MVWGGGLEDTIPEAHPTDQYSTHHRVPENSVSILLRRPDAGSLPLVPDHFANPHSSPACYRVTFSVCVPIPFYTPGV